MALTLLIFALLYTSVVSGLPYTPFEVYGPPPIESHPIYREIQPSNVLHPDIIAVTPGPIETIPHHFGPQFKIPTDIPKIPTQVPAHIPELSLHLPEIPIPPHIPEIPIHVPDISEHLPEVQTQGPEFSQPLNVPEKPQDNELEMHSVRDATGQYSYGVNQPGPEGQTLKEQGRLISTNDGWEYVIAKKGSYSYTSPEGVPVHVEWEADHNGFRIIKSSV